LASIPLPALSVRPPEQQNPVDLLARVQQLRNMAQQGQMGQQQIQAGQLENQQRQMDIQSQQALMKAYTEAEGNLDKAIPLAAKYGAKPDALLKLKEASIQQQQKSLELLNAKGARAIQEADLMQGAHDQVAALPPEQRPAAYQQSLQQLQQAGVDTSQAPKQYPGDQAFALMGSSLKGHKAQLDELAKQAELQKTQAQTAQAEAATKKANMEAEMGGSSSDVNRYIFDYIKSHNLENTPANRLIAHQAFTKETKVDPGVARIQVLGQFGTEVADPNNPGQTIMVPRNQTAGMAGKSSASVVNPKAEQKYMTSGKGGQQLTAFNTAMVHLDTLDRLAAGLNNSNIQIYNKAAQSWAEATGNPAPANFAAAKNAMSGEVAAALKASGATDQEIAKVDSTFSRAQSPAQLKGAINTYRDLLRGKRDQLKKQYTEGMQGKPNFGEQEAQPPDGGFNWGKYEKIK
jgi:hypothetical protein